MVARIPLRRKAYPVALALLPILGGLVAYPAIGSAQAVSPTDLSVCEGVDECTVEGSVCSTAGFQVTLQSFTAGNTQNSGATTYVYEICADPIGCPVEKFQDLSHFDVTFPELGEESCLSAETSISGSCSNGNFVLGDGSCFEVGAPVAKCDGVDLGENECLTMTVIIAGETVGLGVGAAVVVDKAGPECTASCLAGPSCVECGGGDPTGVDGCLTRTIGFWGTHPAVTDLFDDALTVCGKPLGIDVICQVPGKKGKGNQAQTQLERQLAAAKLNLAATEGNGGTCDVTAEGIVARIVECEALCGAGQAAINESSCIDDLAAFNQSEDGVDVTPEPFDNPGPADPTLCKAAKSGEL